MSSAQPILDEERQRSARVYARLRRRLWALNLILSGMLLLGLIATQAGPALVRALEERTPLSEAAEVAVVGIALGTVVSALGLPLSFYSGFVLPHRFGLSNQTLAGWIVDLAKGSAISAAIGLPVIEGVYALLRRAGSSWWIWAGLGWVLLSAVLSTVSPVLLMPMFYRIRPLAEAHQPLADRLARLAAAAGVRVRGVFTFDMSRRTKAANAALAGLGRTRRILLADTLLEKFAPDEVETVLAHELGHHAHRDIPLGIFVQGALQMAQFYLAGGILAALVGRLGLSGPADPAGLPVLALSLGGLGLLTLPVLNAYSRWRESKADAFALRLTGKPRAFASAMTRLANQNLADADPERWVVWLLHSHPPLRERIARARQWEA